MASTAVDMVTNDEVEEASRRREDPHSSGGGGGGGEEKRGLQSRSSLCRRAAALQELM